MSPDTEAAARLGLPPPDIIVVRPLERFEMVEPVERYTVETVTDAHGVAHWLLREVREPELRVPRDLCGNWTTRPLPGDGTAAAELLADLRYAAPEPGAFDPSWWGMETI